ncbi:hypothetical protein ACFRCG_31090 [Embleya sp. NPDC056575]|uniref:hypothetical protein n=1 Tax=unclassified Embleya TaxID=2699296 RepID=UPI0036CB5C1B
MTYKGARVDVETLVDSDDRVAPAVAVVREVPAGRGIGNDALTTEPYPDAVTTRRGGMR